MRKNTFVVFIMCICLLCLGACKNNVSKAVVGTYKGTAVITIGGVVSDEKNVEIVINSEPENKVSLTYPAFTVNNIEIPELNFSHIIVDKEKKNTYKLSERAITIDNDKYQIIGLINGKIADNTLTLNLTINDERLSGSISIKYTT